MPKAANVSSICNRNCEFRPAVSSANSGWLVPVAIGRHLPSWIPWLDDAPLIRSPLYIGDIDCYHSPPIVTPRISGSAQTVDGAGRQESASLPPAG